MVNFRGALRGLGAGLTYLGQQGMEEQQRVRADARLLAREQAFARFGQVIRNEDLDTAVDRDIDKIKAEAPHRIALEQDTLAAREPYRIREDERTAARAETSADRADQRAEQRDIRTEGRQLAAEERRLDREAAQRGTTVSDRYTGEDGLRHYRMADGSESVGTVQVRESGNSADDLDLGDDTVSSAAPVGRAVAETARSGRPTLTPRSRPRERISVRPGQIVQDRQGNRFRVNADGSRTPIGR